MPDTSFRPIALHDQRRYAHYAALLPLKAADYSFTNLWAWAEVFGLEWRFDAEVCWIRQTRPENATCCWAPVGNWNTVDWRILAAMKAGTRFIRVPEPLCRLMEAALPDRVRIEETPDVWEYVYDATALALLKGNRLHKKRNHVNAFIRLYGEDYRPLDVSLLPGALRLEAAWLDARPDADNQALRDESLAVTRVLEHWEHIPGLQGGSLFVDGSMAAFCVGEALDAETLVVHVEKAFAGYRGAYQAINACFAREVGVGFRFINREQDGGDAGLRQAKQSYSPAFMLRKHTVHILA
jgi:Uncharacterized conserved protein